MSGHGFGLGNGRLGGRGSSPFTPKKIAGLVAWYRADMGITIATGVSAWADQSGTGDANKNLTQATGSAQPTFNASDAAYGGKPTLSFAAASVQFLQSGTWAASLALPETVFVVGNFSGAVTNQVMCDGGASNQRLVSDINPGTSRAGIYAGAFLSSGLGLSSAPEVVVGLFNAATSKVWSSALTAAASGSSGATGTTRTGIAVGATSTSGAAPLNGKIAEVIVVAGDVSSTGDWATVMNYLGARYAITIGP